MLTDVVVRRFAKLVATLAGVWFWLSPLSAQAAILITIDKTTQQMTVDIDGATRWIWPVSTGRRGYDTPAGSFRPFRLEEDHYSKEWDEAPMPHSVFFTADGHAIHGSYETRRLGRPASHGCVRLAPKNAERLFTLVKREGLSNVRVLVLEDPNAPVVAKKPSPGFSAQAEQHALKTVPVAVPTPPWARPAESTTYPFAPGRAHGYAPAPPAAMPPDIQQRATGLPATGAAPGWN
jgi:hypothetical protein